MWRANVFWKFFRRRGSINWKDSADHLDSQDALG